MDYPDDATMLRLIYGARMNDYGVGPVPAYLRGSKRLYVDKDPVSLGWSDVREIIWSVGDYEQDEFARLVPLIIIKASSAPPEANLAEDLGRLEIPYYGRLLVLRAADLFHEFIPSICREPLLDMVSGLIVKVAFSDLDGTAVIALSSLKYAFSAIQWH